ncbi:hypothetical protein [Bradyrhizobium lablabi]|uniref:hypothetical protein n=1 Tax=Bradyrhizobium lablabi TaxID=722472 RepID=UPI00090B36F9|nr:hypothetical protein [Bradyrhizobium lablabi]SHM37203.1 hypothetical protein SAMN05444321_6132 [Bradyrhizobium lablabi]
MKKKRPPRIVIEHHPRTARGVVRSASRVERPLDLNREEANGIADFLISNAGNIAVAKEILLKSGPDDAREKLVMTVQGLVRHLATIGVTEHSVS